MSSVTTELADLRRTSHGLPSETVIVGCSDCTSGVEARYSSSRKPLFELDIELAPFR
jgi:hypothetical protein